MAELTRRRARPARRHRPARGPAWYSGRSRRGPVRDRKGGSSGDRGRRIPSAPGRRGRQRFGQWRDRGAPAGRRARAVRAPGTGNRSAAAAERTGVVENARGQREGGGIPLGRNCIRGPELQVAAGANLREQGAEVVLPLLRRGVGTAEPVAERPMLPIQRRAGGWPGQPGQTRDTPAPARRSSYGMPVRTGSRLRQASARAL